jgi:hypothetical protein
VNILTPKQGSTQSSARTKWIDIKTEVDKCCPPAVKVCLKMLILPPNPIQSDFAEVAQMTS